MKLLRTTWKLYPRTTLEAENKPDYSLIRKATAGYVLISKIFATGVSNKEGFLFLSSPLKSEVGLIVVIILELLQFWPLKHQSLPR